MKVVRRNPWFSALLLIAAFLVIMPTSLISTAATTIGPTIVPTHTESHSITGTCDLQITKTITPNPVPSGSDATITLTVNNIGKGPCLGGISITDPQLGLGMNFDTNTITYTPSTGWTYKGSGQFSYADSIPGGSFVSVSIPVKITASPGTITNCVTGAYKQSCVTVTVTTRTTGTSSTITSTSRTIGAHSNPTGPTIS
ncbi:MAG: hypothetical protein ABSD41_13155 [Candidatus Bathyarchaeia archaeon]